MAAAIEAAIRAYVPLTELVRAYVAASGGDPDSDTRPPMSVEAVCVLLKDGNTQCGAARYLPKELAPRDAATLLPLLGGCNAWSLAVFAVAAGRHPDADPRLAEALDRAIRDRSRGWPAESDRECVFARLVRAACFERMGAGSRRNLAEMAGLIGARVVYGPGRLTASLIATSLLAGMGVAWRGGVAPGVLAGVELGAWSRPEAEYMRRRRAVVWRAVASEKARRAAAAAALAAFGRRAAGLTRYLGLGESDDAYGD